VDTTRHSRMSSRYHPPQCQADAPHRYLIVTKFSGTTPNLAERQARVKARYRIVTKFLGSGRKLPHEAFFRSAPLPDHHSTPSSLSHARIIRTNTPTAIRFSPRRVGRIPLIFSPLSVCPTQPSSPTAIPRTADNSSGPHCSYT